MDCHFYTHPEKDSSMCGHEVCVSVLIYKNSPHSAPAAQESTADLKRKVTALADNHKGKHSPGLMTKSVSEKNGRP